MTFISIDRFLEGLVNNEYDYDTRTSTAFSFLRSGTKFSENITNLLTVAFCSEEWNDDLMDYVDCRRNA